LDGDIGAQLDSPAGFDGAHAYASLVYVADDASERLAVARELLDAIGLSAATLAAATCMGDVLIVRWIGREGRILRDAYGAFWAGFRNRIAGYPERMPRLWHM
ncbi:MAG: urease accessory protein UreD, partial [Actinobacteria bacterium]|nr:urease accessory protein UreD [Actinomycetota bacterium]